MSGTATRARGESPSAQVLRFGGYAEVFYQWNLNQPENGITNFRGFDNRHNTFTIANVALDAEWEYENILGRVTLQAGHTPSTYYLAEPALSGASGANATGAEVWKHIQQAYAGYRFAVGKGLALSAGLFLSPIGPEGIAVRDNWNWSRSDLFFGLPFYHTGVRLTSPITDEVVVTLAAYNGYNSVVDNNDDKSISAQMVYTGSQLILSFLYFGGVERPKDAPEGRAFRHLFDAHATWNVTPKVSLLGHANAGFERNSFGVSSWVAVAAYARVQVAPRLFVAARGDVFQETAASNSLGTASPIFWPAEWVTSATVTADFRPHERVSFRLEYRHDHAATELYFGGATDSAGAVAMPNRESQDTLTLGATSWF